MRYPFMDRWPWYPPTGCYDCHGSRAPGKVCTTRRGGAAPTPAAVCLQPLATIKGVTMAKKTKKPADPVDEKQMLSGIMESAQQIWLAGLAMFAKAQSEGGKMFESLVKEGQAIEAKTRKHAEETGEEVRDRVADARGKATAAWDNLEKVFEARVSRSLSRLGVPAQADVEQLAQRVAELEARLGALADSAKPAASKPAATPKPAAAKRKPAAKPAAAASPEAASAPADGPKADSPAAADKPKPVRKRPSRAAKKSPEA